MVILFYSQGIRASGVDAIVKAANTTKMSLYKYFPSKDDLVIAFLRKRDADFRAWFVEQVNGKADTPKAKLLAVFDVLGDWMAIAEFRGCAFINAAAEFPLEGNPVHQVSARVLRKFSKLYCRTGLAMWLPFTRKSCGTIKPSGGRRHRFGTNETSFGRHNTGQAGRNGVD